jgi:hypothetical protein
MSAGLLADLDTQLSLPINFLPTRTAALYLGSVEFEMAACTEDYAQAGKMWEKPTDPKSTLRPRLDLSLSAWPRPMGSFLALFLFSKLM